MDEDARAFVLHRWAETERLAMVALGDPVAGHEVALGTMTRAVRQWQELQESGLPSRWVRRDLMDAMAPQDAPDELPEGATMAQTWSALPPRTTAAYVLSEVDHWDPAEVADALGMPVATVGDLVASTHARLARAHARDLDDDHAGPTSFHEALADLVDGQMMPDELGQLLHAAVLGRKSLVIAGDQGAGKTTLLRALIASIPENERFGTLETDYELLTHLQPGRRNILALQARVGLGEVADGRQVGEFTVAELIPEALRQNLSRLIVGEVRGAEAGAMFEAMQSGAGTMSTTHSHSAESTIDRLAARVAQGGVITMREAYRQVAHHVALIVYVRLQDDTWRGGVRTRAVAEVVALTGALENDRPVTHLVYRADDPGLRPESRLWADLEPFWADWRAR